MILKSKTKQPISLDIGRPDLYDDDSFTWYTRFQQWVKDTPIPIVVNSFYYSVDDMIKHRQSYLGGGFKYMFWFNTEEDKQAMINYCGELNRLEVCKGRDNE
jgi:hypothetical protein